MTIRISQIMTDHFMSIDILEGVGAIRDIAFNQGINYFLVTNNHQIKGMITSKELIDAHPNRIAADAMLTDFKFISSEATVWGAKEIFDQQDQDFLLVEKNKQIVGIITKTLVLTELGKHIDLLTGLYKSDYIYYQIQKCMSKNEITSIIFMDVNNFGRIDKEYGHILGDTILKELARLLKQYKPKDAHICRFGGDEFVLQFSTPIEKCKNEIIKIIDMIKNHEFPNKIPVTISAGVIQSKKCTKIKNVYEATVHLINQASLASTTAKKNKCGLSIVYEESEIA
ncbi:diguanylate cyclase [Inediibacterium massiliense]|uniref:diguanylate cyclase n=1 Tax=Inediibacterium massiliense TaxID=1658111 RepID=UPI0006B42858|nr:GGDEF domain-containing protein [Inediibacterium massiliense]